MYQCKICNQDFETAKQLSGHIRKFHKISSIKYYDLYLKKEYEGICAKCDNPTKFENIVSGYYRYCSTKCGNESSVRIAKIKETKDKKYGKDWREIYQKQQETVDSWTAERKEEYRKNLSQGIKTAHLLDPNLGQKITAKRIANTTPEERTVKAKAGHANRTKEQIEEANQKRKETELIKYGVVTHTQTEEYKKKVALNYAKKSAEEKKEIIRKVIQSKIEKGYILPMDHPDRKSKKEYKNKVRGLSEFWAKIKFSKEELSRRGLSGVNDAVQLDHIVSLETCYRQGVPIEIAAHCVNLRLISWQENIYKYSTDHMSIQELNEAFETYDETIHLK